jgi:ankyrin repeat protein
VADKYQRTALIAAAERGHTEITNSLIAAGASLDVEDQFQRTALMYAAERGHTEIEELLITAGAQNASSDK